jgi:lipopolysaccharide transport system permease protein
VIPEWLKPLYLLNPMAPIIDGDRRAVILGTRPDLQALAVSAAIILTLSVTALAIFKRAERTFADVI